MYDTFNCAVLRSKTVALEASGLARGLAIFCRDAA